MSMPAQDPGRGAPPSGDGSDDSGYAERQPRDHHDARHRGKRRQPDPDPDQGRLDRDPGDDADPAADNA